MNNNETDLLCHLESHMVFKNGMINQDDLSQADRKQIEMWDDAGFIEIEKIPLPDRHNGPVMFTHRLRFSDKAWELAHKFRRKIAQRTTPTLKSDQEPTMQLAKNGQHSPPSEREQGADPSADSRLPSYKGFQQWLEQNDEELTIPQRQSARLVVIISVNALFGFSEQLPRRLSARSLH